MTKPETAQATCSTPQVYTAIVKVMEALAKEGIDKGRSNTQQGYKFRGIDDVYNALSSCLSAAGLCVLPRVIDRVVAERQTKNGGNLFYTTLTVEYDLVCAADGSKHTICTVGEAMDSADKSSNKAMSAAFKYACIQAFCIPTEGDNDADATTHDVVPEPKPAAKKVADKDAPKTADPFAKFWARDSLDFGEMSDEDFAAKIKKAINAAPDMDIIRRLQGDNMPRIDALSKADKGLYDMIQLAVKSRQSILIQAPHEEKAA